MMHMMKSLALGIMVLAFLALAGPSYGLAQMGASNVSLTALCFNTTIGITTDKSTYQFTEIANMTVQLDNTVSSNALDEMLLIEAYDVSGHFVKYMATDEAVAPAGGTNSTSYNGVLSDLSAGNYTLRARVVLKYDYPAQNVTVHDCSYSGIPVQADRNITVTELRPNGPQNLRLILNTTNGTQYEDVTLNWTLSNSSDVYNYLIYKTDVFSSGFDFLNPYQAVSNTTTNWTDLGSNGVDQRYYIVRANNSLGLTDLNTYAVGKFNLKLYTGWNMISLPLLVWDESMSNMIYTATDTDLCERWTGSTFQRTDFFAGSGWFGDFTTMQVDRGYWYNSQKAGYTTTPFNNTIVGVVPTAQRSETINSNGWSLLGWTSVNTKGLDTVFANATGNDILLYFDAVPKTFKRTDYFSGLGWFGEFSNIEPGRGYWYYSQNSTTYAWQYQP
jgi:hypothetical protein